MFNTEITVCIPVYNAKNTIGRVLDCLTKQQLPLTVIAMDNGSNDGTASLLAELAGRQYYMRPKSQDHSPLDFRFFMGAQDRNKTPFQNALAMRQSLAKLVKTPYIFFLDADVLMQPFSLIPLFEEFKKAENCGFMGVPYRNPSSHVMLGASVFKTEVFKAIPENTWDGQGCDCQFCHSEVVKMGLCTMHHPFLMYQHDKFF